MSRFIGAATKTALDAADRRECNAAIDALEARLRDRFRVANRELYGADLFAADYRAVAAYVVELLGAPTIAGAVVRDVARIAE